MATTMTQKTSVKASTGISVKVTLARITCHMVMGAMRSSWKPRRSLGIDGVASVEDMNMLMNPSRKTSVQKPSAPRPGRRNATA